MSGHGESSQTRQGLYLRQEHARALRFGPETSGSGAPIGMRFIRLGCVAQLRNDSFENGNEYWISLRQILRLV